MKYKVWEELNTYNLVLHPCFSMKTIFKWINIFLSIGIFFAALGIAYIAIPYFGNQALIVRSGSMSPTIDAGSIVVVRPSLKFVSPVVNTPKYANGDIISFRSENNSNTIVTHRVVGVKADKNGVIYKTKGDANEEVDSFVVSEKNVLGKAYFSLPYAGHILAFAKSDIGFPLLIILPAVLVIFLELFNIIKTLKKAKNENKIKIVEEIRNHLRPMHLSGLKILAPLFIIGIAFPVTLAFPTDTEKSVNNKFTASEVFSLNITITPTPTTSESQIKNGDVVINEIMWMGSQNNSNDEWIELRNMTNNTIDLSNWTVVNLGTGVGGTITITSGKNIEPYGFFIISDSDNDPQSDSIISIIPDFVANISLLNTGEQLTLRDSSNNIIDTANINGDWFAGSDNPEKSMSRNNVPGDGTVSTSWYTASTSANLDSGVVELATPRAANGL